MKREHGQSYFGLILAALALLLLWLFSKKGLLHESVTHTVGGVTVTPSNTITPDPATGYPRYDTRFPETVPEAEAFAIAPIDVNGRITEHPSSPSRCTCPVGYDKWVNSADSSVWCLPTAGAGASSGALW